MGHNLVGKKSERESNLMWLLVNQKMVPFSLFPRLGSVQLKQTTNGGDLTVRSLTGQ